MAKKLFIVPCEKYNKEVIRVVVKEIKHLKKACYITLNKTFSGVEEALIKKGVSTEHMTYIDSISPLLYDFKAPENVVFINSLSSLSSLAQEILTVVKHNKIDILIFDSVSSLLVYTAEQNVLSFFEYILPLIDNSKADIVLFALSKDSEKKSINQIEMMVDETKPLKKKGGISNEHSK